MRPEQTPGPFFVDEGLLRSDIRADPSDGSLRPGVPLSLTIVVSRLDGAVCSPFAGVVVDLWQCDALGLYSDVDDGTTDTRGKKFLRGYQVTDATGAATFLTIYPGWYPGRTVHVHFKLRTEAGAEPAVSFTSQLYFDDAVSDVVLAEEPYASRGARPVRNGGDGIYLVNGSQLRLDATADGAGGYAATFVIGLRMSDGPDCDTVTDCLEALRALLPDPASAADAAARRTARRLRRRANKLAALVARAERRSADAQWAKARTRLDALLAACRDADSGGSLGVPLGPIEAAVAAVAALLPS